MKCAICHEETLGRDPVKWGPEFAHRTCVVAFDAGMAVCADICTEEANKQWAAFEDSPADYLEGRADSADYLAQKMRSNA